jgi:hypothetical protein
MSESKPQVRNVKDLYSDMLKKSCKNLLVSLICLSLLLPSCDNFEMVLKVPRSPHTLPRCSRGCQFFNSKRIIPYRSEFGGDAIRSQRMCSPRVNRRCTDTNSPQDSKKLSKPRIFAGLISGISRLLSRFASFFSSKYGPIQRFFRALIFEFKIAKRVFKQESKRYNEQLRTSQLANTFSNIAEVETEVPAVPAESANADNLEDLATDSELVGIKDVRPVNSADDERDEEIRVLNERKEQFFKAIGVYDNPDENESLLDSEYKKNLEYYLGIH